MKEGERDFFKSCFMSTVSGADPYTAIKYKNISELYVYYNVRISVLLYT